ncbi:hypothetical protein LX69_01544 [Breznakibacter xylanolyticus]|uniref:Uncharacterized protein n=1 Tax=Breznakibacter xylanolyticus TaxID=990 RepID=A0A2W7Q669_9BACT|nr:hypothetical protein LX69_01544 [Breznakibacter xylanolyticus]
MNYKSNEFTEQVDAINQNLQTQSLRYNFEHRDRLRLHRYRHIAAR